MAEAARAARCSVEPWSCGADHGTSCRPSTAPEVCATTSSATHASAAMSRGGSSLAPPPQLRPRPTTACRYPTVFNRLQPPPSRPTTPAERLQHTNLQRSTSAQILVDNRLRQDALTKLGYSLPLRASSSYTLPKETTAGSPLGTGAPPLLPCRSSGMLTTRYSLPRAASSCTLGTETTAGSPLGTGAPPLLRRQGKSLLTTAYGQAATPAATVTPSRTPVPPRTAWNDVRPPPDEQGPWRAMLLAANWSNCVEDEAEAGCEEISSGGKPSDLGDAGAGSGEAPARAQGAREMGRHMREAGFGRGRHMRAAMWD